jgi:hypothetical protein
MPSATFTLASCCCSAGAFCLPSTHSDFGEASVDGAHRTGGDRAADKARNHATPEAHVTGRLVGPSIPLTPLRFRSR